VDADVKTLESTDQTAIDNGQKALFKPLEDDYDRNMKIAAGS
jgi:hypothetical protein